jgi:hypothetical protein
MAKPPFGIRWVHVFEEDTPAGDVYRPDGADIPLSRRPRECLELDPDGTARVYLAGPGDRPEPVETKWRKDGEAITIAARPSPAGARRERRIVEWRADRLVVRK